jgi:hypothetical protein
MAVNRRRKARQPLNRLTAVARKSDGTIVASWTVRDVSESGARLAVGNPESLPDEFILQLTRNGRVLRRCRVAWKKPDEVGVKYAVVAKYPDEFAVGVHFMR